MRLRANSLFVVATIACIVIVIVIGHALAGRANAQVAAPANDYPAAPLLSTNTTILGETIRYPKTGPAHVTAAIVTLAPGPSCTNTASHFSLTSWMAN